MVDAAGLPTVPKTWCWAGLSELAEIQLGQRRAPEYAKEATFPYVRAANITWRGLELSDVKSMGFADPKPLFLQTGDVLLNEASGSASEVGKPAIWRGEIKNCCFQATVLRVRSASSTVSGSWLYAVFLRDATSGKFAAMAPGVGILHLTAERMRNWAVPLAPTDEQHELTEIVERSLERIYRLEDIFDELTTGADHADASILSKAFRGALVPQAANEEPAGARVEEIQHEKSGPVEVLKKRRRPSKSAAVKRPSSHTGTETTSLAEILRVEGRLSPDALFRTSGYKDPDLFYAALRQAIEIERTINEQRDTDGNPTLIAVP